jgi:hypothetical protein
MYRKLTDKAMKQKLNYLLPYFGLFTSFGTIFCCALPALFVLLGAGAVFASITATFPQMIFIAEHKDYFFLFAGIILSANAFMRYKNRNAPCPIDPLQAKACKHLKKINDVIFWFSICLFLIAFFVSYLLIFFI